LTYIGEVFSKIVIAAIAKESFPDEKRVALIPRDAGVFEKAGLDIVVETGAGDSALHANSEYEAQGARIESDRAAVFSGADLLLTVRGPGAHPTFPAEDLDRLHSGAAVIGFLEPLAQPEAMRALADRGLTVFAMELIPRTTRAQSMDALSSMANIAGYEAVLLAAKQSPKMFPMMMTAAGTITPSKVFVVGAGVAGLQAIATARRLGALVEAYDIRPEVKEQVESLGARFVELEIETEASEGKGGYAAAQSEEFYQRQRELLAKRLETVDVVITTAAVPGKRAPVLITKEMAEHLPLGAVVVDLAAEKGGNCELTRAGEEVVHQGVTILGPVNLPAEAAYHASQMYSKNLSSFVKLLVKDGKMELNLDDDIISGTLVAHDGKVVHPAVRKALGEGD
jgi:NAD(P) transhydrogenase subunit alpha